VIASICDWDVVTTAAISAAAQITRQVTAWRLGIRFLSGGSSQLRKGRWAAHANN
jgi:hypothetical protein